jgi:hypothetical protein
MQNAVPRHCVVCNVSRKPTQICIDGSILRSQNHKKHAEGLLTGQTKRVFTAIWTCKTQPMPEESESEEEEEEEWEEAESQDLPQTRVGKVHRPPPFHTLF